MKQYIISILSCSFVWCLAQQAPGSPILQAIEQKAETIKTIDNTLTLKHITLFRVDAEYLSPMLENLQAPPSSSIQIQNPQVGGFSTYDIPNKITFQGNFSTKLHFSNGQEYPFNATLFLENLTTPTEFNAVAQEWIQTTIPEFIYKVKYSSGVTLAIDQNMLKDFLATLLQKVVAKWRQLVTVFKVEINQQKTDIASIKASKADQEKVQQLIKKLDAVFTQLIPF